MGRGCEKVWGVECSRVAGCGRGGVAEGAAGEVAEVGRGGSRRWSVVCKQSVGSGVVSRVVGVE